MLYVGKQGVQGYQKSHSDQLTGQHFVGKPDQTRPDQMQRIGRLQPRGPNSRTCVFVVAIHTLV